MKRNFVGTALAIALCFTAPFAYGEQRGKGNENKGNENKNKNNENKGAENKNKGGEKSEGGNKGGSKPPGGEWSEGPGKKPPANQDHHQEAEEKNKSPQASGAEGAAAGAAASNRNKPPASGAEGATAGAAAANRNKPAASGAEGAAAGAAAANRNKPAASGAEGAAIGAAAAGRNNPSVSGAQGAAIGVAAAGRNQPAASGAVGAAAGYGAVRDSFDHPSLYNQQWHTDNPDAWTANKWPAGAAWTAASLAGVAAHSGYANNAVSYGYGNNVTNQNGNVIVDGQNVGTAEDFSQQAADLAQIGQNAQSTDDDEWLPLGVFALVRNEDQHAQLTVQLAINKQGILQGNYTDLVSDHTLPIHGSVDKQTQRAAWTVGNNKNFFMEAGLSNLTSGDAPALIHKYSRTEKWFLVRLPKPDSADIAATDAN